MYFEASAKWQIYKYAASYVFCLHRAKACFVGDSFYSHFDRIFQNLFCQNYKFSSFSFFVSSTVNVFLSFSLIFLSQFKCL